MRKIISAACLLTMLTATAQTDSIYPIKQLPVKISHAEPVFIDMIRDLGARKGEKEINLGWEMNEGQHYLAQGGFIEYEFSPLNRLGLEIEIPFCYRYTQKEAVSDPVHHQKIEGIKLAAQYTFLVSEKSRLSMALGGIYETELHSFKTMAEKGLVSDGNNINPFLIVAKRLGRQFHTLLYTGPVFHTGVAGPEKYMCYQINASAHYVLPQTRHFIGLEINHEIQNRQLELVARPQVKFALTKGMALGMATGIPLHAAHHGLSFMVRLVYEPGTKK